MSESSVVQDPEYQDWFEERSNKKWKGASTDCFLTAAEQFDVLLALRRQQASMAPDPRPVVHAGEVAATLFNDLALLFKRIQMADAFEAKVTEAAKSPAAWLLLREELNGGTSPPDRTGEGVKP